MFVGLRLVVGKCPASTPASTARRRPASVWALLNGQAVARIRIASDVPAPITQRGLKHSVDPHIARSRGALLVSARRRSTDRRTLVEVLNPQRLHDEPDGQEDRQEHNTVLRERRQEPRIRLRLRRRKNRCARQKSIAETAASLCHFI